MSLASPGAETWPSPRGPRNSGQSACAASEPKVVSTKAKIKPRRSLRPDALSEAKNGLFCWFIAAGWQGCWGKSTARGKPERCSCRWGAQSSRAPPSASHRRAGCHLLGSPFGVWNLPDPLFGGTPNSATGTVALPFSDCIVPAKEATDDEIAPGYNRHPGECSEPDEDWR